MHFYRVALYTLDMRKQEATEIERCEAGCDNGYLPCPHDKIDGTGWCTICDTPEDEINPQRSCKECW